MSYKSHKADVIKTRLVLEIGNETDSVLVPIMSLPHAMRYYRLVINKPEIDFQSTEFNFSGYLSWNREVRLSNVVLDMPISVPATLSVKMWLLKTLKILLGGHSFLRCNSDCSRKCYDGCGNSRVSFICGRCTT